MKAPVRTHLHRTLPLLGSLTTAEMEELSEIGQLVKAKPERVILHEGAPGNGLWLIVSGAVRCQLKGTNPTPIVLATLTPGSFFGEMSLLDDAPVSATIQTTEDTVFFYIPKAHFNQYRLQLRPVAYKLLRAVGPTICERLRSIRARIEAIYERPEVLGEHLIDPALSYPQTQRGIE